MLKKKKKIKVKHNLDPEREVNKDIVGVSQARELEESSRHCPCAAT